MRFEKVVVIALVVGGLAAGCSTPDTALISTREPEGASGYTVVTAAELARSARQGF